MQLLHLARPLDRHLITTEEEGKDSRSEVQPFPGKFKRQSVGSKKDALTSCVSVMRFEGGSSTTTSDQMDEIKDVDAAAAAAAAAAATGGGGGRSGMSSSQPGGPPAGLQYSIPGILHFLQHEWSRFEMERGHWDVEKAELQVKLTKLFSTYIFGKIHREKS